MLVEVDEHEATVALHAWRLQRHLRPVEELAVTRLVRRADKRALVVEGPSVVEALEHIGVAVLLTTDHGAPVGAGIVEGTHPAILAPGKEDGPAPHVPPNVVARLLHLRLMAKVEPALLEDAVPLLLHHLRRGQRGAVIPENPILHVIYDQTSGIHTIYPLGGLERAILADCAGADKLIGCLSGADAGLGNSGRGDLLNRMPQVCDRNLQCFIAER